MKLHKTIRLNVHKYYARKSLVRWSYPYEKEGNFKTLETGLFITF